MATWTSRWPAPATASPRSQMDIKIAGRLQGDHARSPSSRPAAAACTSWASMEEHMPQPRAEISPFAPPPLHDRRSRRTRSARSSAPVARPSARSSEETGCEHRDRQRRQGHHRGARRRGGQTRHGDDRAAHRGARDGPHLRRRGHPDRVLRRLRRDHAGHRRPAAHQRARPSGSARCRTWRKEGD